jgi:hypothetical protein
MTEFGLPDKGIPVPVSRRALNPLDADAIAHAERRVAEGMSDCSAIMDAIAVVNPSPGQRLEATYSRLNSRFRAKHGSRKDRVPA